MSKDTQKKGGRGSKHTTPPATSSNDDRQPQYRLTGKASVQLGGPDDGKVTMLDDDLMPIEEKRQRSSAQGVAGLLQQTNMHRHPSIAARLNFWTDDPIIQ